MTASKQSKRQRWILILSLCTAVAILGIGSVLARYLANEYKDAQMQSSAFHVSSNLLEKSDPAPSFMVADWAKNGIVFSLYNYEKENTALISDAPTCYRLNAPSGWTVQVTDGSGTAVPAVDGVYTLPGRAAGQVAHRVTLTYAGDRAPDYGTVSVCVTTVSPYATELRAEFVIPGDAMPEYEIADCGTYVLVTLRTNGFEGAITVEWTAEFSPDNTNPAMADWVDTNRIRPISVMANTTYRLIFFKNTVETYNVPNTRATKIDVGGD